VESRRFFPENCWSVCLIVPLAFLFWCTADSLSAKTVLMSYPSNDTWFNSGVTVSSGDDVLVFAYGITARDDSPSFTNDLNNWWGPDGDVQSAGDLINERPSLALLGKIGDGGVAFAIGSHSRFTASSSGTLYLGVNDSNSSDNVGFILAVVYVNSITSISQQPPTSDIPRSYGLKQNYPNPFNPQTTIPFSLAESGRVTLKIYNSRGQLVRTLLNETKLPGEYEIVWDGRGGGGEHLSSGAYYYQIESEAFQSTRKMITLK